MAGKQAKILADDHIKAALSAINRTRYPLRNRVMFLLSVKAGLRAGEIANLTWPMVCDADGNVGDTIELHDLAAKKCSGRTIPLHPDLKAALIELRTDDTSSDAVVGSERGTAMHPGSVVNWFAVFYRSLSLHGCSSHSGRRTFITKAARLIHRTGGSLRDIQELAGHRSIEMTQRYIDGDTRAKRKLVALL